MLILFGRATRSTLVGSQNAYCGGCLEVTSQAVHALAEHTHIYFAQVEESVEAGQVATCSQCRGVVQVQPDFDEEVGPEHRVDAFLDRQQLAIEGAHSDLRPMAAGFVAALGVLLLTGLCCFLVGYLTESPWTIAIAFLGAMAAFVAFHLRRMTSAKHGFEREVEGQLREIHRQTGWDLDDLCERADARGCGELRDFLAWTALELDTSP